MTVTVGSVSFDGATGTPTPPLTGAQLASWAAGAEAYRYKGSPPTGEGTLDAWADLSEADALARLRAAGGLIGQVLTVTLPHGTIVGVAVANVTGAWQAKAGTVNGGVLLVRFVFNRGSDRDSGDAERSIVDVQTASALAGPWTTQTGWIAMAGSDGLGTYAGESQAKVPGVAPDKTKLGKWVRITLKGANPETDRTAIRWVGVIVGVKSTARRDPSQGIGWGTETVYRFAGIAHALAQIYPPTWYEACETSLSTPVKFQGATPAALAKSDVGHPLVFNADNKPNMGTESFQLDAAPASTVKLHARGMGAGASMWTALDAVRTCIAQCRKAWPTLPRINTPGTLLAYSASWDVSRQSLLGMINTIIAPAHGRTFRLSVDWDYAGGPAINVTPVDITAAGTAFDLTGSEITDWSCDFDAATQLDAWYLDAGARSFVATVDFTYNNSPVNGVRGWSAADETDYDAASINARESLKLAHVWRRFILEPVWNLTGYLGLNEIPYIRTTDATGETGELAAGSNFPAAHTAWKIERTIPIGEGQDWTGAYPAAAVPAGSPAIGPLVFYKKTGQPLTPIHTQMQVSVMDGIAGIVLGNDDADAQSIRTKTKTDGYTIVATLSFVHPFSFRASAQTAFARTDMPRVGFTYLPSSAFNRVDSLASAIIGTDGAGAAVHAAAGRRDGTASLKDLRDAFKSWYTSVDGAAEWRRRDASVLTPDPGTVVASVEVTLTPGPPVTSAVITVGSPIARRVQSWDLYAPGVTWSASRIVPSLSGEGGNAAVVAAKNGGVALGRNSAMNGVQNA